ncbi:MAG TPA: His/Gly/Thr/Pro-type tRNA ligase C-terminal domain-containing protein, partial [Acidimicrobiales bacterium]
CWTTSWGVSTRMMGGLIMCHGDDQGIRVPPRVAGVQAVVMVVRDDDAGSVTNAARRLVEELTGAGVRARLDAEVSTAFGRRATDWELKGVPVRVELGPRDVEGGEATTVRRDQAGKFTLPLGEVAGRVPGLLAEIQESLLAEATSRLEGGTAEASTVEEAIEAAKVGFARVPFDLLGEEGEDRLAAESITVRCLQTADGEVPDDGSVPGLTAIVARAY